MAVQSLHERLAQAGWVEGAGEVDLDVDGFRFLVLEAVPGHLVHDRERDACRVFDCRHGRSSPPWPD
ncbi:hypothetical protein [Streptomyces sp. F001]|uniref:hypothetical protein n=1 Tax=Streptomyces sp. F001 TaxID=1510026 RepID=UPI001F0FDEBA|nr:hypothetical protein [Streptomyces sp. F001]